MAEAVELEGWPFVGQLDVASGVSAWTERTSDDFRDVVTGESLPAGLRVGLIVVTAPAANSGNVRVMGAEPDSTTNTPYVEPNAERRISLAHDPSLTSLYDYADSPGDAYSFTVGFY